MTSGEFHSIDVSTISVDRIHRQRKALASDGIGQLADSIRKVGLIHPIVIQRDTHELIAGERRFEAIKSLGWTHVSAQYVDEVDPLDLKLLELEENTKRIDLTWQEQCLAVDEYHSLMLQRDPEWTSEATGKALLMSPQSVNQKLDVSRELKAGNQVVATAEKFSTARGLVQRKNERAATVAAAKILELEGPLVPGAVEEVIETADFREWWKTYDGPKFNFIHCDFPYGINADKRQQGYSQHEFGGYADTPDVYFQLLSDLHSALPKIADESCHLMFWFSMTFYQETIHALNAAGWRVDPFPLVWVKSDGTGLLPDPERGPRRIYETALFASRGDRKIVRATSNACSFPHARDIHMSEKNQSMLEFFFRMFVDTSTSILDPTAGSGSALRAAKALGASYIKGLEINPEFAQRANERFK